MTNEQSEIVCGHEAAHGVMRCICGLPATELTISEHGGYCAGTGRIEDPDKILLVTLAGFAWESGCGANAIDFNNSSSYDFDEARDIIANCLALRLRGDFANNKVMVCSVEESLSDYFDKASNFLIPYSDIIEELAEELEIHGNVSAQRVEEILHEWQIVNRPIDNILP